jgi:hypothetical protein
MTLLIKDNIVITDSQFRDLYKDTSFGPVINYAEFGYSVVFPAPAPAYDPITQYAQEVAPILTSKGHYEQQWEIVAHEDAVVTKNQEEATKNFINSVTSTVQARLDEFAKTRNYDNILSACTYASSSVDKFKNEGFYCVNQRDATWAKLYEIMTSVQSGTRTMPTMDEILTELPVLAWPS